jgi:hypothetical protein
MAEGNMVVFSYPEFEKEINFLQNRTEPFSYKATDGQAVL